VCRCAASAGAKRRPRSGAALMLCR
jgi:hypothetical protein